MTIKVKVTPYGRDLSLQPVMKRKSLLQDHEKETVALLRDIVTELQEKLRTVTAERDALAHAESERDTAYREASERYKAFTDLTRRLADLTAERDALKAHLADALSARDDALRVAKVMSRSAGLEMPRVWRKKS